MLEAFGFGVDALEPALFLRADRVVRMGVPPMQIEILTSISGVDFDACYASRVEERWDDAVVSIIGLAELKENKRASGRLKDLSDLEHLE